MSQVNDANKMNAKIEKLKEVWKEVQGEKSTAAEGLLNPETGLSSLNTDPFSQIKGPIVDTEIPSQIWWSGRD